MLFILIFVAVALLVLYCKLKYFTLRGPLPGLPPQFLFGNLLQTGVLNGASLPQTISAFKKRFGDIFQIWIGPARYVVVSNIRDVEHIFTHRNIYDQGDIFIEKLSIHHPDGLICIKGAKFKRHASLSLPLFRRGKITSNLDLIVDCTDKLLAKWRHTHPQHIHLDIVQQCQNLLLAIFGLIGFNYDLETLDSDNDAGNNELTQALRDMMNTIRLILYSPKIVSKIYIKLSRRQRRAKAIIERYIYQMIEHESAAGPESIAQRKRTSLIASLVSSLQNDEKLEATKSEEEKKGEIRIKQSDRSVIEHALPCFLKNLPAGLSRSEVLDEMVAFLIAGYETTSTALSWFIHLMSKHPRVQQKIKAELMDNGSVQNLSPDRLDSLVYLDCVINEVLRFCPPANATTRTLTADDQLPESGAQLYKGDSVFIPLYNLSHDTLYWSIDPELFYPERFLGEDKNHPPYALIPFGSGHRQCIGQDLARFELKVIAARLMQHVTFGDGGPTVNAGGHLMRLTIIPKHVGVTIEFA